MRTLPAQLLAAARILLVLSVLLGIVYPLAVLGVGRVAFDGNADGSRVSSGGRIVGSDLIGQSFTDPSTGEPLPAFFQSRPSNAGDGYDPLGPSGAGNRGPEDTEDTPPDPAVAGDEGRTSLLTDVLTRGDSVRTAEGLAPGSPVPPDAVTASGSGLDPHISPEYARLQVARVARERGLDVEQVGALVEDRVQGRVLGFLGEPRVNVLELNLALEELT